MRAGPAALLVLAVGSGAARLMRAQVAPNRTSFYLHPTDVTDARALWVNPAGLGRISEASVHFDLTVVDPGAAGRVRQLTFGFASRGFSFGYQRDLFSGGPRGHTYRVGMASGLGRLAGGGSVTLYRGGTSETGWDLGGVYDLLRDVSVGGVIANIGHPVVRGARLPVTLVPGATLRLFRARAARPPTGPNTPSGWGRGCGTGPRCPSDCSPASTRTAGFGTPGSRSVCRSVATTSSGPSSPCPAPPDESTPAASTASRPGA